MKHPRGVRITNLKVGDNVGYMVIKAYYEQNDSYLLVCHCGRKVYRKHAAVIKSKSCGCMRNQVITECARKKRLEEEEEDAIYKPQFWGTRPCPKCKGRMESDRYFGCHKCVKLDAECWTSMMELHEVGQTV